MRQLLRALVLLVLLAVVLAGAGIAYLYLGLPRDRVVADIAERLETETGRAVEIEHLLEVTGRRLRVARGRGNPAQAVERRRGAGLKLESALEELTGSVVLTLLETRLGQPQNARQVFG